MKLEFKAIDKHTKMHVTVKTEDFRKFDVIYSETTSTVITSFKELCERFERLDEKLEINEIAARLMTFSPEVKESIYREVKKEYTKNDVLSKWEEDFPEDFDPESRYTAEEIDDLADTAADEWSYDGKYDCNLSYWENIENRINEQRKKLEVKPSKEEDE